MKAISHLAATAILIAVGASYVLGADEAPKMLSHDVYFTLKDDSPKAKEALVAGCKKFLSKNPGIVWFAVGGLVEEHDREVNDREFDVALHIVFKDKASHDKYQTADAHHKFIEEFSENWEKVRVFDSWLTATAHGEDEAHAHDAASHEDHAHTQDQQAHDHAHDAHQEVHEAHGHDHAVPDSPASALKLPDAASHFAGMIEGTVAKQTDRGVVVSVAKVLKSWQSSKAKHPEAMVGKDVHVIVRPEGNYGKLVGKFIRSLKTGERVELDVAHREGEALVLLELTEAQRRRVAE